MRLPSVADIFANRWLLLANASLALFLNFVIALCISRSSSVTYSVNTLSKDAIIVVIGALVLKEAITTQQAFAFSAQLFFIGLWSLMKGYPEAFENGVAAGLARIFC